ncbi:MAG: amidase [Pseudomonadota bacterium]|nr:amidase [Pseudomonadota bacterium]
MSEQILDISAEKIAEGVGSRKLSASEVASAFIKRIEEVNPVINAICTLSDTILEEARAIDERLASGGKPRPLEGVPFLIKDILQTKGVRTTFGSLLLENDVPDEDTISVERLKAAGGILLGKTNTPEFAHDINTSNKIFGTTRNPWNVNVTAGGSSGGAGASIAAAMAPLAIGTDLGGSIRIPCSFNNLVGLRPTPGRIPFYPTDYGWDTLVEHVQGPMVRSISDIGLAMHVLSGPDERDPSSLPNDGKDFLTAAKNNSYFGETRKIAYAGNLGGVVPLDPEVESLVKSAVRRFEELGFVIEEDCFDTSTIKEIVTGTRGFGMVARYADRFDAHSELMTDQLVGQVSAALQLSVRDVVKSEKLRTQYWHNVRKFMHRYDFIIAPAVGAPPFRLDEPFPTHVGGQAVERFQDVFLATYVFSVTGLPMISLPCGITKDGRPVGMQVIAKRFCDDQVITLGAAYEKVASEFFCRPEVDLSDVRPVSGALNTPNVFMGKTS